MNADENLKSEILPLKSSLIFCQSFYPCSSEFIRGKFFPVRHNTEKKAPKIALRSLWLPRGKLRGLDSLDADGADFFRAFDRKQDFSVLECEQGVILAHADIVAGVELGAALTDDDRACRDQFAAEGFDT